jgi:4'-phosphopantetheinyl transferase
VRRIHAGDPRTVVSEDFSELPPEYGLAPDDVHVWVARIDRPSQHVQAAIGYLSSDEREKAQRFHSSADASRHIVGRGLARGLLGRLLGIHPASLCFHENRFGKPRIADAQNGRGLQFNISHSGDLVLVALARGREVGVDVERLNRHVELEQVAARMFCRHERDDLMSLPVDERLRGFFCCWCRKEAFIKAGGKGLSMPLDKFDVSLSCAEPVVLVTPGAYPTETNQWTVRDLDVGPSHAAAVAAEGLDWQLKTLRAFS